MSSEEPYFVGVHEREIERLRSQHHAWAPETTALWERAGFGKLPGPAPTVIDLGCGPGFTTLDLARTINGQATVIGLDKASSFLSYLNTQASEAQMPHVRTLHADITAPGTLPTALDGAFCRWFLAFLHEHLDAVLGHIYGALRPGGVFAAMEYLTLKSVTCSPPCPGFDAHTEAWIQFYADHGGNTNVGTLLAEKLRRVGFTVESIVCVGGLATPGHRWYGWWGDLMRHFGETFVEGNYLSSHEWQALQEGWRTLASMPHAFIYTPVIVQVIARKGMAAAQHA